MEYPNPRLLLFIGMADAYAAGAEYLELPEEETFRDACLRVCGYAAHPRFARSPSLYTDDTEMSVANVKVLVEHDSPYIPKMFADAWVEEFHRGGKRKGYARGFQAFLEGITTGEEFLAKVRPSSDRNGAAMRAVPFGALPDVSSVLEVSDCQAQVTHDTPSGRFSARAVALMSHFALYESAPLRGVADYCLANLSQEETERFGYVFRQRWIGEAVTEIAGAPLALTTIHAVVDLLLHQPSLLGMLRQLLLWGGDTDSVAAISWGIASARFQDERLPDFLARDLEGGSETTGAAYLCEMSERLMKKFS